MRALLPVITTRRSDRRDRGYLASVAIAGEVAHLPLETAPIDGSTHVLEIYVEGFDEPLVVLADPVGVPDDAGFPLRLGALDEDHADALRLELFSGGPTAEDPTVRPEGAAPHRGSLAPPPLTSERESVAPPPLSQRHLASLAGGEMDEGFTASGRAPGSLTGRGLAGGRFVLETLLGTGAAGEVYRAMHTVLRRPCAVKVLHPSLQRSQSYCTRFYAEALAASQLDHRNVLRIFDYGQEPDGTLYIVMELLEGRSLQQILDTDGRLELPRLVDVVSQACAGLGQAHDAGIVHRDIKPENIVVVPRKDDEGNATDLVKVCDFGIAHWVPPDKEQVSDDDATLIRLPVTSNVVGTPAYMAPEQCRNEAVDARTDVYALGVVLYELSTGQLPFTTFEPVEMLMAHATKAPAPPSTILPDFDRDLERVIIKALEKDPAMRQPNVRALRAELRALVSDGARYASVQSLPITARVAPAPVDLATHTADALADLNVADPMTRIAALPGVADALRAAMSNGNVRLARELVTWLHARLTDRELGADEHQGLDRAIRVARDPAAVRALTAHLFGDKIARLDDAFPVLAVAGPVAARELLEARRSQPPSLEARVRFVACMRATGGAALPVILGALAQLTALASRADEALADDLLRAAPEVPSDEGGELARRFVRPDRPALAVVALQRTVAFWGPRAYALLLGVLDSAIDSVRLAAVEALQRLGTLDDWAIDRLGRILVAEAPGASAELRAAAAGTLALAPPQSRPRVVEFIRERLARQRHGLVGSLLGKAPKDDAKVVLALARSLMALDPAAAKPELDRVLDASPELRVEINAVLAGF